MEQKTELQLNALEKTRRRELLEFQRAMDMQWLNTRMEDAGMARCLALIQREAAMEKEFQERTDHAAIVNANAERETLLGLEVAKIRREETCELLRRHYLRQNDHSLKEYINKLERGYTCRDLKLQILNNQYKRLQEQAEENHAHAELNKALFNDEQEKVRLETEKMERNQKYCAELQQQMVNRRKQKQCQYEDTLIEKKMLDDIIKTMYDEDVREIEKKRKQDETSRHDMITSQKAKEAWKQKQKQMLMNEERDLERQAQAQASRSSSIVEERERKEREKEALNFKITEKIRIEREALQERADIITLLQEQELLEKSINDDKAEKDKVIRMKAETKSALTEQMEVRKREAAALKKRDEQYRIKILEELAKADAKEHEKERIKKEKQKQYTIDLMQQMEISRKQKQREKEEEVARGVAVFEYQKEWDKEVEKEREKITEEHAPNLLGYLQAGVIQRTDLPAIKRGIQTKPDLKHLDIDSLTNAKEIKRYPKCNAQCRIIREY